MNRPTVPDVVLLIRAFLAKPENGAGGNLHVVLEDSNLHLDHFRYCEQYAAMNGDEDGVALARTLAAMSWTGRRKAIAVAHYGLP
jgi:hypothetical protein